jgi:hypothetical protein
MFLLFDQHIFSHGLCWFFRFVIWLEAYSFPYAVSHYWNTCENVHPIAPSFAILVWYHETLMNRVVSFSITAVSYSQPNPCELIFALSFPVSFFVALRNRNGKGLQHPSCFFATVAHSVAHIEPDPREFYFVFAICLNCFNSYATLTRHSLIFLRFSHPP